MQHTHTHSASNNTDTTNTQSHNTPWQLIGLSPVLAELTLDIHTSLSIGRSDNNDLVLASPQISRQHAKINRIGDGLYIQDLGSSMAPSSMPSVSAHKQSHCSPPTKSPLPT